MLTQIDVDTLGLESEDAIHDWEAEFQEAFNAPIILAQQIATLMRMSDEERAALREQEPELFGRLRAHMERLQHKAQGG